MSKAQARTRQTLVLSNFGLTFYKEDITEVTVVACFISQEREK